MTEDKLFFEADEEETSDPELDIWMHLLRDPVPPVKLGNKNKTGKCGMCGKKEKKLYPRKVGQIDFMICERCKAIMDIGGVSNDKG